MLTYKKLIYKRGQKQKMIDRDGNTSDGFEAPFVDNLDATAEVPEPGTVPIPIEVFYDLAFLEAAAARDISGVYRALQKAKVSQRHIASLTGQSQSEVSEILSGRIVHRYDVLARIADGLGIPREWMGLGQRLPKLLGAFAAEYAAIEEELFKRSQSKCSRSPGKKNC